MQRFCVFVVDFFHRSLPEKSRQVSAYIDLVFVQDFFRVCAAAVLCEHQPLYVLHCELRLACDACCFVACELSSCQLVASTLLLSLHHSTFTCRVALHSLHTPQCFCQFQKPMTMIWIALPPPTALNYFYMTVTFLYTIETVY